MTQAKKKKLRSSRQNGRDREPQSAVFVTITPEDAGEWLSRNPHNRKLRDMRVRRYAKEVERGQWKNNGESIKFDYDGNIVDGQHRLAAIVFANKPITTLVVRGLDPDVFDTVDTGMTRVIGDALHIRNMSSSVQLGSALGYLWRYRHAGVFGRLPGMETATIQDLEELLAAEPRLVEHVGTGYSLSRKIHMGQGLTTVLRYLLFEVDEEWGYVFWEGLQSGTNLKEDSPIYRLRERLTDRRAKILPNEQAALTLKAWNAFRKNQKVKVLVWRPSKEPMPQPE